MVPHAGLARVIRRRNHGMDTVYRCKQCSKPIPTPSGQQRENLQEGKGMPPTIILRCPHCGTENRFKLK